MAICIIKIEKEDYIATFMDNPEIHQKVFNKLINWYFEHGLFSGEEICQCDEGIIEAPILLSDIAEDIIKFDIEWR